MAPALQHRQTPFIAGISTASAAGLHARATPSGSNVSHAVVSLTLVQNIRQANLSLATLLSEGTKDKAVLVEAFKYAILATKHLPKGKNKARAEATQEQLKKMLSQKEIEGAFASLTGWEPLYQETHLMSDSRN